MRRRKCQGCGRPSPAGLCTVCLDRLPQELRSALEDTEDQYGIDGAARRWLRQHPEGAR